MEEINLDLESNNHKNISIDSTLRSSNNSSNISIFKDETPKESNIGIDLLINKSKTGSLEQSKINEFKPTDPIASSRPRTDSIESGNNVNITLTDIGSGNSNPRNSISNISTYNDSKGPISSISLESDKKSEIDITNKEFIDNV